LISLNNTINCQKEKCYFEALLCEDDFLSHESKFVEVRIWILFVLQLLLLNVNICYEGKVRIARGVILIASMKGKR
jgi:hypothetical protein